MPNTGPAGPAAQAPRDVEGGGLRARRDAAYYRASIDHCRQLHGRVRTLCFEEAQELYAR